MNPYIENLLISLATGVVAAGTLIGAAVPGQTRDWGVIGAAGIVSFCGAFINGMRQLHMEVPKGEATP